MILAPFRKLNSFNNFRKDVKFGTDYVESKHGAARKPTFYPLMLGVKYIGINTFLVNSCTKKII